MGVFEFTGHILNEEIILKKTRPLVSVVILSWNTLEETKNAIASVLSLDYPTIELIVVDNGSNDGSKDYLAQLDNIVYVDLPVNTGFTGGQIAAYERSKGAYIALVNSDAVVAKDWLDVVVKVAESDPMVAAVGGRAYVWREGEQPFNTDSAFYSYQVVDAVRGYAATCTTGTAQTSVDSISGAAVLIRRSIIETVGYFDNRFFAYFEETDLFARFQRAGYKVVYEPTAHTWHMIARSTKDKPYFYLYHMHRNRFMFAFKNFDSKPARRFAAYYTLDALRAHWRYVRNRDLDNKARIVSFWWNVSNLPRTLRDRRSVQRLGQTYTELLTHRPLASDITVIIPCYNYAQYLSGAIESVFAQTLRPTRILVIDDGSTDDSSAVAKEYKSRGVELISKHNEGVVATKNLGIKLTNTTWTVFLDADDLLHPDYLEKLIDTANTGRYDIVYTDMEYFGARGGIHKSGAYNFNRLLISNFIHNSSLIATHKLQAIGGYKPVMNDGYEDWELYITLAESGASFAYMPRPALRYRQHDAITARNSSAESRARKLVSTVHSLHATSYRRASRSRLRIVLILRRLIKNPLLPLVAIAVIPLCLIAAVKAFFVVFLGRYNYRVRSYLHNRDKARHLADKTTE